MATTVNILIIPEGVSAWLFSKRFDKHGVWDCDSIPRHSIDGKVPGLYVENFAIYNGYKLVESLLDHSVLRAPMLPLWPEVKPSRHSDRVHEHNNDHKDRESLVAYLYPYISDSRHNADDDWGVNDGSLTPDWSIDYPFLYHCDDEQVPPISIDDQAPFPSQGDVVIPGDKDNREDNKKYNRLFFSNFSYGNSNSEIGECQWPSPSVYR